MIVRASPRRLQNEALRNLQPAFEQIRLPWLCPAFYGIQAQSRRLRHCPSTFIARRRPSATSTYLSPELRDFAICPKHVHRREFAYAAVDDHASDGYHLPFQDARDTQFDGGHASRPRGSEAIEKGLKPYGIEWADPTSPIMLSDSTELSTRRFRRNQEGIGGGIGQIHASLEACLQVGRLQMAAKTMRRLNEIYELDAPELIRTHNFYITMMLGQYRMTQDDELLNHVHKWFQVDLVNAGVRPNATTFSLMIQVTLLNHIESKVARTIRRLLTMANELGLLEDVHEVLSVSLEPQKYLQIIHAAPEFFQKAYDADTQLETILKDTQRDETEVADHGDKVDVEARPTSPDKVLSTAQKGYGLDALKSSLNIFNSLSHPTEAKTGTEFEYQEPQYVRQIKLEEDTVASSIVRWRKEADENAIKRIDAGLKSKSATALMWQWQEAMLPLVREEIEKANELEEKKVEGGLEAGQAMYGPFLQYTTPEKLCAITIISVLSQSSVIGFERGVPTARMVSQIGKAVEEESIAECIKLNTKMRTGRAMPNKDRATKLARMVKLRNYLPKGTPPSKPDDEVVEEIKLPDWSSELKAQVGAALLSCLIRAATIDVPASERGDRAKDGDGNEITKTRPAFETVVWYTAGRRQGIIKGDKVLSEQLSREPLPGLLAKHLPMLVPPKPWTNYRNGGYLRHPAEVVRVGPDTAQTKNYIRSAVSNGDMRQVFVGLDILGSQSWKINRAVFDVMIKVWNSGEAVANIAPSNTDHIKDPESPPPTVDQVTRLNYQRQLREIANRRTGLHGERCFQNFQLEVAGAYLNEKFYLPHNVDFRGRAYPLPPYLNHMGADHCRGLLTFGDGKELGERGLMWLKIHLANVFGYDKASLEERSAFTEEHIADVYDSANHPLDGKKWWLRAESPWQCLATCVELRDALESPEPTKFVSHLPIHQDGTCNGLQHYAALGGDAIGAKQVNLEPGEKPSDIYSAVAGMVQVEVVKDAAAGDPVARLMNGKVTRKVVKPTVMTKVYGVTFSGARLQVLKQLEDLYPELQANSVQLFKAGIYITRKIFGALGVMFNGAENIQIWLGDCAARISDSLTPEQIQVIEAEVNGSSSPGQYAMTASNRISVIAENIRFKSSVIWTTPLRMPVVQPYRKPQNVRIETNLHQISLHEPSVSDPVHKRKQLQGFPPNFIHSLDATHMLLSAVECHRLGLAFAAVHDSFWTHAADIDVMSKVLREAFIRMHSEDIMGRLATEFATRYKGSMYLGHVSRNSALGDRITELRKTRKGPKARNGSKAELNLKTHELVLEHRRLKLLASSDPIERAEGETMMTPGRLFAETADERDLMLLKDSESELDIVPKDRFKVKVDKRTFELSLPAGIDEDEHFEDENANDPAEVTGQTLDRVDDETAAEAEKKSKRLAKSKKAREMKKVWLWLPVTFPPVPKKGNFDVGRVKESKYFFS